jgi:hypothetical protein
MTHKRRKQHRQRQWRDHHRHPDDLHVQAVDPAELADALSLLPAAPPARPGMPLILMTELPGDMVRLQVTEHPFNGFVRTLQKKFATDRNKVFSLILRTLAPYTPSPRLRSAISGSKTTVTLNTCGYTRQ